MDKELYRFTLKVRRNIGISLMIVGVLSAIASIPLLIFSSLSWWICLGMIPLGGLVLLFGAVTAFVATNTEQFL